MRILETRIKGYKSLADVQVTFEDLTIFIGKNGSGKTNFLEALNLFFRNFSCTKRTTSVMISNDSAWFNKDISKPIEFIVKLRLDPEELEDIFSKDILSILQTQYKDNYDLLTIHRTIRKPGDPWITNAVKIVDAVLAKNSQLISPEELIKLTPFRFNIKVYNISFGIEIDNTSYTKLLEIGNNVYPLNKPITELINAGEIPSENIEHARITELIENNNRDFKKKTPATDIIRSGLSEDKYLITPKMLEKWTEKIDHKIQGTFELIPASRDVQATSEEREPFLDQSIIDSLVALPESQYPQDEVKWDTIRRTIEGLVRKRIETVPSLSTWDDTLRLSIESIGGGEQAVVGIIWHLYSTNESSMTCIEEPEAHLNAGLARKLFELLKTESQKKQIVIVTHSPIFIDRKIIKNNWLVERVGKKTQIRPVEDLAEALEVVGAQPSDRVFPNKVLLVAGETEEDVFPIWLDTLNIDTNNVKITHLEGEWDKRKVAVYHEFAERTQTNVFLIVDEHGAQLIKKATERGVDPKNCLVLQGTIEDCYPPRILVDVLNDMFDLTLSTDDIDPSQTRLEESKRILREQKNIKKEFWKRPLGKEVAKQMTQKDIPEYLRKFLEKLTV